MTPKQKAKQLFDKAIHKIQMADKYWYLLRDDEVFLAKLIAKETAQEVIESDTQFYYGSYWEQVKNEIDLYETERMV